MVQDRPGPGWMANARRAGQALRATRAGARGASHSVYVILLHYGRRADPWRLYVGQTARDPDWRFDQHTLGYKASGAARRIGVGLLPELVSHLNPMRRSEAVELQAALAEQFRRARVPWVDGSH